MSPSSEPPDEELTVTSAAQYRALGHPLRHRLLFALGQHPATISQLATAARARRVIRPVQTVRESKASAARRRARLPPGGRMRGKRWPAGERRPLMRNGPVCG